MIEDTTWMSELIYYRWFNLNGVANPIDHSRESGGGSPIDKLLDTGR